MEGFHREIQEEDLCWSLPSPGERLPYLDLIVCGALGVTEKIDEFSEYLGRLSVYERQVLYCEIIQGEELPKEFTCIIEGMDLQRLILACKTSLRMRAKGRKTILGKIKAMQKRIHKII